jgi:hypothetical protein
MACIYALPLYIVINLFLGYRFHRTVRDNSGLKPKLAELLMYVLMVSALGLPIVLATTALGVVAGLMHNEPLT